MDGVACRNTSGFPAALACAQGAALTVAVVGLDASVEAEGLDRNTLALPGSQVELVQALLATGTPTVLVVITGGPVDLRWALPPPNATGATGAAPTGVGAIVLAGYASQATGIALADVLLGRVSPAGKLAVSWHGNASSDLPDFGDMGMRANASSPTAAPASDCGLAPLVLAHAASGAHPLLPLPASYPPLLPTADWGPQLAALAADPALSSPAPLSQADALIGLPPLQLLAAAAALAPQGTGLRVVPRD
jgi:hypothetical protein